MTEDDQRIGYILEQCTPTVILTRIDYLQRIISDNTAASVIVMDTDQPDPTFYDAIRRCDPAEWPDQACDMRWDDCMIVYTSGTTGKPKGVVLMQQNLFVDGEMINAWHGIDRETRMMCVLPVHHVNGAIVTHATPFIAGASVVLHRKFSPSKFFSSITAEQVHIVSVVPTLLALLLEANVVDQRDAATSLRHIICGAGPLTCELAERFTTTYNTRIIHGYGLSETTCYSSFLPVDLPDADYQHWMFDFGFPSIGTDVPCNEMAIQDAQGNAVPDGERGEIVIRGANVMRGYDNNDRANEEAFAFGWFRSGDEGFRVLGEDGRYYYFITGRLKELIIRGGVNLAPLEIDEVISRAPGVKAGICVGFEHTMFGEEVGALVIPTGPDVNESDVLEYCRRHLPFHKTPKVVVLTDALPVTSTGKYQRNSVKHVFAAWKDTQFRV